ncbi:MAG: succinate dehydrogenase/fumarate reductase flavoprotein subunit, partial [Nitrososphaera sp.]
AKKSQSLEISQSQVANEEKRIYDGLFRGSGSVNPYQVRKELTDTMDDKAYVFRTEQGLSEALKKVRELKGSMWKHVDDKAKEYNTNFVNVMEIDSMLRTAEVVLVGALNRKESRGAHSRTDYPTRDDSNFLAHTIAYHTTEGPRMAWHPVTFTRYAPVERKY